VSETGPQLRKAAIASAASASEHALRELVRQIRAGECILFVGAGVHAPQSTAEPGTPGQSQPQPQVVYDYPVEVRPLLGGALAEQMATHCDFHGMLPNESPRDLQRVSLCYEKSPGLGRNTMVAFLTEHLMREKKPSPVVRMLAALPFKIIVTTNYDRLMEMALRQQGKDPNVVVYDSNPDRPTRDVSQDPSTERPLVFKMHGDLDYPESIVITDEDYITFVQRMSDKDALHPVPMTIRFRMQRWSILFVGYSLRDYNLRLLFRTLRWRMDPASFPPSFSIDCNPDPLILQVWQNERQFITFVTQDMWSSVPYLFKEVTGKEYGNG
jgi:hypothetical protein